MPWTAEDMPDLKDQTIVVTGGNSGIGLEAARQFARKSARVVLACRDLTKAKTAAAEIERDAPGATVEPMRLDLASLDSVRRFVAELTTAHRQLHVLCNNAGVMAIPYARTADGFEMQFGTNHLGHFALTGLLLERLLATPGARVVSVSSGAHRMGKIRFEDLQWETGYGKWRAYGQSKLANLLFTFELQRRLEAAKAAVIGVACHPGYAATNLQAVGPRLQGSSFLEGLMQVGNSLFAQSAAMGALPTMYAATAKQVRGGEYFGPDSIGELWGHPKAVECSSAARDREVASRLWKVSEELTGVTYLSAK